MGTTTAQAVAAYAPNHRPSAVGGRPRRASSIAAIATPAEKKFVTCARTPSPFASPRNATARNAAPSERTRKKAESTRTSTSTLLRQKLYENAKIPQPTSAAVRDTP